MESTVDSYEKKHYVYIYPQNEKFSVGANTNIVN